MLDLYNTIYRYPKQMQNYFPTYTLSKAKGLGIFLQTSSVGLQHELQHAYKLHTQWHGVSNLLLFSGSGRHRQHAVWDQSKASAKHVDDRSSALNISLYRSPPRPMPLPNESSCYSHSLYLSLTQVLFSNSEHKLAHAEGSETKTGILSLFYTHSYVYVSR